MSTKKRTIDAFFGTPKSNTVISTKKARASPTATSNARDEVIHSEVLEDAEVVSISIKCRNRRLQQASLEPSPRLRKCSGLYHHIDDPDM